MFTLDRQFLVQIYFNGKTCTKIFLNACMSISFSISNIMLFLSTTWLYPLKHKYDFLSAFLTFQQMVENEFKSQIKKFSVSWMMKSKMYLVSTMDNLRDLLSRQEESKGMSSLAWGQLRILRCLSQITYSQNKLSHSSFSLVILHVSHLSAGFTFYSFL